MMKRSTILNRLRPTIRENLDEIESSTNLIINFTELSRTSYVVSEYYFDTTSNAPYVRLRNDWQDLDVAHELMHMKIELINGFHVLAWKKGVDRTESVLKAFGCIRTYVDDEIVHNLLIKNGLKPDGEVFRSQLFDDIYTRVTSKLKKLKPHPDDGMSHLDKHGYGDVRRCAFLIQAENIVKNYSQLLPHDRLKRTRRFISEFRTQRSREAEKADKVLSVFNNYDVMTVDGHKEILRNWAEIEDLTSYVGLSVYKRQGTSYVLPWPHN